MKETHSKKHVYRKRYRLEFTSNLDINMMLLKLLENQQETRMNQHNQLGNIRGTTIFVPKESINSNTTTYPHILE